MRNKKLLVLLSMILVLALVVVGCGQTTEAPGSEEPSGETPAATKDTLVVAQNSDAKTLDPHGTNDNASSRVTKQIYETLIHQNEKMELSEGLATSWEQVDELTYEFKLKEGVKFHNGEELTANDVKFTFERALGSSHVSHIVDAINPEGIEVVDNYTIRIATTEPFAPLLNHLAHPSTGILNEKAVTEAGENYGTTPETTVGTGPFILTNWVNGDSIELSKFDGYHGEAAKVSKVLFRAIAETTSRTIGLETGEIDIIYDVSPTDVTRVEENTDLVLHRDDGVSTTYVSFNVKKEPFNDVRVRQAINHAVNMDLVVEAVYQGVGKVAKGPLPASVWGANQELQAYEYDVEKAKALLKEAGYENGFKTTIWTNDNQQRMDIAEILQNQLKEIGIEVEVKVMEWGAYLDGTAAGEHDMFILGWGTVTGDPNYGLFPLFHTSAHGDAGNRSFYSNPTVDELLEKGKVTVDPAEREQYYLEAQQIIRDEAPWVFTWDKEELSATRSNVKGFVQQPAGHHDLKGVYFE